MISSRELEQWVERNRARLSRQGITAAFGMTIRVGGRAGVTWISFLSRSAEGRVVRAADGCCEFDAHRFADGAVLHDERRSTPTIDDLDGFVLLLGRQVAHAA